MKNNQKLQKDYIEFQVLNQQINQLQQQLNSINNNIVELKVLGNSLDEIKKLKKENKILIPLGNNIFIKGKIEYNNELIMGVGSKTLVKKDISNTKDTINNQIKELENINIQLEQEINKLVIPLEELQEEILKEKHK